MRMVFGEAGLALSANRSTWAAVASQEVQRNSAKRVWFRMGMRLSGSVAERHLSAGSLGMKARMNVMLVGLALAMTVPGLVAALDGVVMKDGHMMMMKDGRAIERMTADLTMTDGTKVTTSGVVKMRDGEERQLSNGAMMLMNGHLMKGGKAMPMLPQ